MARQVLSWFTSTPSQEPDSHRRGHVPAAIKPLGLASPHQERPPTAPFLESGRPIIPVRTCATTTPPCLSLDDQWQSLQSSSDSDSDSDIESGPERNIQQYALPQEHQFQQHRQELLQFSQKQLKAWTSRVQYEAPPRSRSMVAKWRSEPVYVEEDDDVSEMNLVVVSRGRQTTRHFHLACPFHAFDPVKYRQCLIQHEQQSIEGLIHHISHHHAKPFYCARCSETFDTAISRDNHILDGQCELLDPKPMDGIDRYQKGRLWRRDKWYHDERKRWRRIWTTVLPSQPPRSPYLDHGLGLEVSMARDFWDIYGWRCVSEFLESRGYVNDSNDDDDDDERALKAICDLARQDLLKDIIGGYCSPSAC